MLAKPNSFVSRQGSATWQIFEWCSGYGREVLLTRRRAVSSLIFGSLAMWPNCSPAQEPTPSRRRRKGLLVRPGSVDLLNTRSKVVLELDGQLQIEGTRS